MIELPEYKQRMIEETDQLDANISDLSGRLIAQNANDIPESERSLMGSQLHAMRSYRFFLAERMRRW